jgi:mRNA-degrading endonuclease toxin of MazEF toxin-antitoxin module
MNGTTTCRRGSIVLVRFVFADEKGAKHRPALVISGATYHNGRREAVVAAITSHVGRHLPGDHLVDDWQAAGLIAPSTVTGILRTIKQDMIVRAIGTLPPAELTSVDRSLRLILELP